MKLKKIVQMCKRDNRNLKDIFEESLNKIDIYHFNPYVGLNLNEKNISNQDEANAFKNAKYLENINLKEVPLYD